MRKVVQAAFGREEEADLVDALRTAGEAIIALVALNGSQLTGQVLLSPMRAPERCLGLGPVSVLPDQQGRGIGSQLIRAGIARARDQGWHGIFLLGHANYYPRFGFSAEAARGFASPFAGRHFMFLALTPDAPREGPAQYAAAFGEESLLPL